MAKALPTEQEIMLLIADDVRQEMNKKISLVGFYPGGVINVRDIGPNTIIPLTFCLITTGGEGEFRFRMNFDDASGTPLFQGPEATLLKLPNVNAISIVKFMNFPIRMTGLYRIRIFLDDHVFERFINVGHDPTLQLA
jgi:hypothetical protein